MTTSLFSDQPVPVGKRPIAAARVKEPKEPDKTENPLFREPGQPDIGTTSAKSEPPPNAAASDAEEAKREEARRKVADELARRIDEIEQLSDEELLEFAGLEPAYSTTEAAQFFDRSNQWVYWGLRDTDKNGKPIEQVFRHKDGTPIDPERIGDDESGRRRFTLPILRDMLRSSYQRGNITDEELKRILRRIRIAELGGEWREREGWHFISGRWVHPSRCEKVNGRWVKKKRRARVTEDDDE